MASIPGIAYVVIGAFVAVYSQIAMKMSKEPGLTMQIFFYIGLALLVIGGIKTALKFLKKQKKEVHHVELVNHETKEMKAPNQVASHHAAHHLPQHHIIHCTKCGTKNYSTSNFCHKCGQALH